MLKNRIKNIVSIFFATFVIVAVSGAINVKAAIKPKVREKSVTIYTDSEPYTFHFTNLLADSKVSYSSSDKSVIKIKDSLAFPVKVGKATVTISIDQHGKTYKLKVKFKVKEVPKPKNYTENDYKKLAKKQNDYLKKTAEKRNYKFYPRKEDTVKTTKEMDELLTDYTKKYISFILYIPDFSILRSEEEYLDMFPYLTRFKFTQPNIFLDTKSIDVECEISSEAELNWSEQTLMKAIKSKDTSDLDKTGKKRYKEIVKIAASLKGETDFETLKNILDYVSLNVDYEYDETVKERYNMSYALEHGMAVCSGYAKFFHFLCITNGINSRLIHGYTLKDGKVNTDTGHLWNLIELDHKWYHVDVTWDDCYNYEKGYTKKPYRFFMIDDELMKQDHIWDESKYPKADSKNLAIWYSYLEEYPMVTGKKETLSFIKEMAIVLRDSDDSELLLEFNEMSYSDEVYDAVCKYLRKLKKEYGISYKNLKYKSQTLGLGRTYSVILYK